MTKNPAHPVLIADVIEIRRNQPMVSSLRIAELFERRHDNVLATIRKELAEEISVLKLKEAEYSDEQGKPRPMFWLNERQALFVMPFVGGRKSREGQRKLVDGYLYYRDAFQNPPRAQELADKRASHHVMMDAKKCVFEEILGLETTNADFIKENLFCNRALTGTWGTLDETKLDNYDLRLLKAIRDRNAVLIPHYPKQTEPGPGGKTRKDLLDEFVAVYRIKRPRLQLVMT